MLNLYIAPCQYLYIACCHFLYIAILLITLLSVLQILTIGLLLISSGIGSFIVINRLKDFRKTAELTKKKKERFEHKCDIKQSNNIEKLKYQIFRLEEETHELGKNTWCFLRWQIWLFFAGLITGVVYLVIVNNVSSLR